MTPIFSPGAWRVCFQVESSVSGCWQVLFTWRCHICGPSLLDQAMHTEDIVALCTHARCKIAAGAFWMHVDGYAFWLRQNMDPSLEPVPLPGHLCEQCFDAPAVRLVSAPWGDMMGVCGECAPSTTPP